MFGNARFWMAMALAAVTAPLAVEAAPIPDGEQGVIRDRKDFIPSRKHAAIDGKIIAVLVGDPQPVLGREGRSGPADSLCISVGGNSYRWVYVPAEGQALITNLQVPTGDDGGIKVYPKLNMANLTTTKPWGVTEKYTLVEVEVNDGLGSPAGDSFVATKMKVLDGSKEFPIQTAKVVAEMQKKYEEFQKESAKEVQAVLEKAQADAIKDKKPTGPRTTDTWMYLTWLPDSQKLRIHFLTRISDGAFETATIGGGDFPLPPPRPPLPVKPGDLPPPPVPPSDDLTVAQVAYRPAPPRPITVKYGMAFGVEYGRAYEISKEGKLERELKLPPEGWKNEIPPPPGAELPKEGPRPRPLPLPVKPGA